MSIKTSRSFNMSASLGTMSVASRKVAERMGWNKIDVRNSSIKRKIRSIKLIPNDIKQVDEDFYFIFEFGFFPIKKAKTRKEKNRYRKIQLEEGKDDNDKFIETVEEDE